MLAFQIFPIILFVNLFQFFVANVTNGRCETKLGNGTIKVHCCDNQEVMNGICVECKVGFISDKDEPCQPCPTGFYGRKCGDFCKCNEYEICHHVVGCLYFSTELSSATTSNDIAKTIETTPDIPGSLGKEMVIYIISTSCVTFVLTLCLVTLKRFRKRNTRHLAIHSAVEDEHNASNAIISNQAQDHNDRVYDEIDESQMIDLPTQNPIPHVDSSSDISSKGDCSLSDGYLNPYQPIVYDPELHDYLKTNQI